MPTQNIDKILLLRSQFVKKCLDGLLMQQKLPIVMEAQPSIEIILDQVWISYWSLKANIEEWQLVCTVAHPFAQNERILKLASIFERSWTFLIRKHLMICHLQDMKSVETSWKIWGSKWLQGSPPNFREMQVPWMNMAHFGCPGQDPLELSPKYLTLNQILCKITHL